MSIYFINILIFFYFSKGKTKSLNGNLLNLDDAAFPCGEIAYTYFNDTYKILNETKNKIDIDESDLAWESDR